MTQISSSRRPTLKKIDSQTETDFKMYKKERPQLQYLRFCTRLEAYAGVEQWISVSIFQELGLCLISVEMD